MFALNLLTTFFRCVSFRAGMVRQASSRKFGLTPKGRKDPFQCAQVVAFALEYGVCNDNRGFYLLPPGRGIDVRGDVRGHVQTWRCQLPPLAQRDVLARRQQFPPLLREEEECSVQAREHSQCGCCHHRTCVPFQAARNNKATHGGSDDACVFKGFNGSLVKKNPEIKSPGNEYITYAQFSSNLAL